MKVRNAPGNLTEILGQNVSSIYHVLYRTTDSYDMPSWAVTTLLVPTNPLTVNGSMSMMSYLIPYNTVNVDYSPSYALDSLFSLGYRDILPSLARGWYVNIPDFEGPEAAFTVSVEAAHATLDSILAASAAESSLKNQHVRSALWGYSGGSLPSEFAAEILPYYAPDIDLVGSAIGGLLPNISHTLEHVSGTLYTGLSPLALLGVAQRYPEVRDYLDRDLKDCGPYNKTTFLATRDQTTNDAYGTFAGQEIEEYFKDGDEYLAATELDAAIDRNWHMGSYFTPRTPLYFYKAIQDEMSPIQATDDLVAKYCADGAAVLYERNTVGNHLDEYTNGRLSAFNWLVSALEGTLESDYGTDGCTIRNVTESVEQ